MQNKCEHSCGSQKSDRLTRIFEMREKFMKDIRDKHGVYGEWPLDMRDKKSQQQVRNLLFKGVEETFEAVSCLKNSREHRQTEIREFDREAFLEEIVDAFNYFLSALVLAGANADELFAAYEKKDAIIHNRLNNGY